MRKFFKILGLLVVVLIVGVALWVRSNLKDRHPGYKADLKIVGEKSGSISAGFAAVKITPEVPDRWTDANGDAKYNPKDGDTFTDGNGNGVFDPVWIAGFSNSKAANGIHDDLWARTMIIDDGKTRIALVVLDAIGLMADHIIDIRKMIPAEAGVTYTIVSSTHDHEAPDLMGLWGKTPFKNGVNPEYMKFVKAQAVKSVVEAVQNMKPASLQVSEDLTSAIPLVKDTRQPEVFDSGLRLIRAVNRSTGETLGSLVAWTDHAETLWSKNLLITSDFCHYVREMVEKGVYHKDSLVKAGIGGVSVYINGAVGGLMTTHPSLTVKDPITGQEFSEPSFEKAEAQGKAVSLAVLKAMDSPLEIVDSASISLVVKTVEFPIDNTLFKLGAMLGILDRGTVGWMKMRSEVSACRIGPLTMVTIPGEPYPELINGGIEAPEGNDFGIQPRELPVVRDMMPGKYKFVFGLANDEIGYIIPKSQWDVDAPYTYNRKDSPYGEENSLGPETAFILHKNLQEIISELPAK
ncbi:MAG: neutral/alkaline non-lysosomal ceramidase N-terminal domain-containing protein [Prolixibacteraceae bacterium]|nr:neutral/alkaline non-lysosomal ceramidase N-terminal domain-containing protein [Prolixibacteraceae bacterium]